ncbi:MAG: histidine kinase [Lachnospiraceae bacterium]|nr:histidine kinase [Lachnospiraceae bacterium]
MTNAYNIGLDICSILLCLIGIGSTFICRRILRNNFKTFIAMFVTNVVTVAANMFGLIFKGNMSSFAMNAIPVFNFCEFAGSYVLGFLVSLYIIDTVGNTATGRKIINILAGVCIFAIIMLVISQFTDLYYYIDEYNIYHRTKHYWAAQIFGLIFMMFDLVYVITFHKNLTRKEVISFLIYIIAPSIAMIVQVFIYGIYIILLTTSASVILMLMLMLFSYSEEYVKQEQELMESRIAIMRSQIKPHFLYNSLTAIARLCDSDPDTAKQATLAFADYLRSNMNAIDQKELIPFKTELNHIRTYLYLEKLRFGDELNVEYDIKTDDFYVPALSVQPIIENAVKWGAGEKEDGGTVKLSAFENEKEYVIVVEDDGHGFDINAVHNDDREHIGIRNVCNRIEVSCHGTVDIDSRIGEGTKVTIRIPKVVEE